MRHGVGGAEHHLAAHPGPRPRQEQDENAELDPVAIQTEMLRTRLCMLLYGMDPKEQLEQYQVLKTEHRDITLADLMVLVDLQCEQEEVEKLGSDTVCRRRTRRRRSSS